MPTSRTPSSRSLIPFHGRTRFWLQITGCYLLVLLSTCFGMLFSPVAQAANSRLIWIANGVLLAYLLLAPKWRWHWYLLAGFTAQISAMFLTHSLSQSTLLAVILNICEALLGAVLIRRRSSDLPRFTDGLYLVHFLVFPILIAPLVTGLLFSLYAGFFTRSTPLTTLATWAVCDGMGIAVTTPAIVCLFTTNWKLTRWRTGWFLPILVVTLTLASYLQTAVPIIFCVYPLLVLTLLQLGLGWATLSLLFVSVTSSLLTSRGMGPFIGVTFSDISNADVLQQLYIATGMVILYSVSVVLEKQRANELHLQGLVEMHKMVTEYNRDVIILADMDGRRRYVSAASEQMSGWACEEVRTQGSMDLVHPLDLEKAETALRELRENNTESHIELRVRRKDDSYVWVESILRSLPDPRSGKPRSILNIVRDISDRKNTEQQLREAYNAVEALAVTDALTGLSNRRRFDQYLTSEWRRSMREHQPLSLLMLDADFFKTYNDTYGHNRGDSCLKQIAEAAQDVVSRPGDMVARFGGE